MLLQRAYPSRIALFFKDFRLKKRLREPIVKRELGLTLLLGNKFTRAARALDR